MRMRMRKKMRMRMRIRMRMRRGMTMRMKMRMRMRMRTSSATKCCHLFVSTQWIHAGAHAASSSELPVTLTRDPPWKPFCTIDWIPHRTHWA